MQADSTKKTLGMATGVALVCSVLVAASAVYLKPIQDRNAALEKKRNVLLAGGMLEEGKDIEEQFKKITPAIIDLKTGDFSDALDSKTYNLRKQLRDPAMTIELPIERDIADIKRTLKYSIIYIVKENDILSMIILPVYGKGLWSTMRGFIALSADATTIKGLTFYEHGETPGLGGEVDNPRWKVQWRGKIAFDENWVRKIEVIKGKVDRSRAESKYQVDGLSGATITTRGVNNLVAFWLGEDGFWPFIKKVREGGI